MKGNKERKGKERKNGRKRANVEILRRRERKRGKGWRDGEEGNKRKSVCSRREGVEII